MNDHLESMENPYPGLRPFQADETHLFFGRDEQRIELLGRLRKSRFLAVVGTSGSGKSSLVRAGLLPSLYGGFMSGGASRWHIVDTRPGGDPIGRLAKALDSKEALRPDDDDDDISFTEAALRRTSVGLINVVKEARLPEGERVLVLVDQFEELFRFVDTAKTDRVRDDASAFVKLLLAAAEQDQVPIYVVITMRSDFLGDCARFRDLPEAINVGQYLIPRLTRDQRREAITGPASVCGTKLSPTLVNRLLNDVGDTPDQLPILQHALMRTFDRWQTEHPDADTIKLDDYEDVGGMEHALSRHADAVFKGLGENVDAEGRRKRWHIAEKLFKWTTDMGKRGRKIRRLAKLEDIAAVAKVSVEEVAAVIEVFRQENNSFLMPPIGEELQPDTLVDISHESLIRNWSRLNRWVDQEAEAGRDYRLLAQKAELHEKGEEDLLGRQALRVANEWKEKQQPTAAWAKRYGADFESAMDYLARSDARVTARQSAWERRKRIRRAAVISAVVAIVTPLMMFLIFAGQDAEWAAERDAVRLGFLNGGADRELSNFLKERMRRDADLDWSPREANAANFSQDFVRRYELAARLESNDAFDHADIVRKYTSWQESRGVMLVDAIWDLQLEPGVVAQAVEATGAYDETQLYGKDLDTLLYDIEEGQIRVLPEDLRYTLRPVLATHYKGRKGAVDLDQRARVDAADRWLSGIYEQLEAKITPDVYLAIKESFRNDQDRQQQQSIAERAVFNAMQRQLRELAARPANDVAINVQALDDLLAVFKLLEAPQESEPEEKSGNATDPELRQEVVVEEVIIVGTDNAQRKADLQRAFRTLVELGVEELESRFENSQADSRSSQSSGTSVEYDESEEEQRKIAFVWAAKSVREAVQPLIGRERQDAPNDRQLAKLRSEVEAELKDIREEDIYQSFGEVNDSKFTLWKIRDNPVYKKVEKQLIDLYGVFFFGLLWFVWSGWRRHRARKGETFAAHVGVFRLGLASLVDVFVAFILGSVAALAVGGFVSLLLAIGLGSFEATDVVWLFSFILVFGVVAIAYLLLRDVMHFRYRRSVGKILFEFRPIDRDGNPLGRGESLKRNWQIFIGIVVAAIAVLITIIAVDVLFVLPQDTLADREVNYLFAIIAVVVSVFLLGLFERFGGRRSKTTVIDTRSKESAIAASTQPSATALQPAST